MWDLMARLTVNWTAMESIAFNVIGGILTIIVSWLFHKELKRWHRRRFKEIFGAGDEPYSLVYARFILRPDLNAQLPDQGQGKGRFFLAKESDDTKAFSAKHTASACEVRAASYVASAIGKEGNRFSSFVDDESLKNKLDIDFVSFGAMSNRKTLDIFKNSSNDLAEFDARKGFFVWKKSRQLLCTPRNDHDYGIVLKIHPVQFPGRTWIACAGLGETGTSGSAWFLARKWKELEARIKGPAQFVALIEVEPDKDESAILVNFGTSPSDYAKP